MLRIKIDTRQFTQHIKAVEKRLQSYINKDAPRIIGIEAVNFFKENFDRQGFLDKSLKKWKPAKRTNSQSKWYGFSYRATTRTPDNHPRRAGTKRKYKARKENPITNYSPAATKRKTLIGDTGDLKESIDYKPGKRRVIIKSDLDYAKVQNEGGMISVFGKKTVKLPQRKFMGESKTLNDLIKKELDRDIINILKNKK
ncbi:MAG: hypothetical protein U9N85_01155 [Bacteroidota bacterium]|nr:hypothetical protein [Bacteroidota bacterium]